MSSSHSSGRSSSQSATTLPLRPGTTSRRRGRRNRRSRSRTGCGWWAWGRGSGSRRGRGHRHRRGGRGRRRAGGRGRRPPPWRCASRCRRHGRRQRLSPRPRRRAGRSRTGPARSARLWARWRRWSRSRSPPRSRDRRNATCAWPTPARPALPAIGRSRTFTRRRPWPTARVPHVEHPVTRGAVSTDSHTSPSTSSCAPTTNPGIPSSAVAPSLRFITSGVSSSCSL